MPEPIGDLSSPGQGWDSVTTLVQDRWIDRRPRRPAVANQLRMETQLMPWLAGRLPLRVPQPFVINNDPLVVRHELVPGEPIEQLDRAAGRTLAGFLRRLHDTDVAEATTRGLPTAENSLADRGNTLDRFHDAVVPLLPAEMRSHGVALLEALRSAPAETLVHADLGPEHVLCVSDTVTGVIDFGDAHVGDRAIDLGWALYDTPPEFAAAVDESYGASEELRRRALLWHQLGPWYEVVHGQDQGLPEYVRSGVQGILRRLR